MEHPMNSRRLEFELSKSISTNTELLFRVLAGEAVDARCEKSGDVEQVIPLDQPIDAAFLANYRCNECDALETGDETGEIHV